MTKKNVIILTTIIIAGIIGFLLVLYSLLWGNTTSFDDPIRYWFYDHRSPELSAFVTKFTLIGNWQSITLICIVLLIIKPTRIKFGVPLSIGAIVVSALNKIIKHLVLRPRPDQVYHIIDQGGYSFPSGHSITAMFFFGLMLWLVHKNVQNKTLRMLLSAGLVVLMFGIGLSRIYCGVHYPSDVMAGWCLGIFAAAAEILVLEAISRRGRA